MAKTKQPEPRNFEQAIEEVEKILADMEAGEVSLEESISRYERGNFLLNYCRQVLGRAQQQIEAIDATAKQSIVADRPPEPARGTGGKETNPVSLPEADGDSTVDVATDDDAAF